MPLVISDAELRAARLTGREAGVEFACRLFEAGRLALWPAAKLAGLSRVGLEGELPQRGIALCRPGAADLKADLAALDKLGSDAWPALSSATRRRLVLWRAESVGSHRP
jgi:predicted HTH domain antitoxin